LFLDVIPGGKHFGMFFNGVAVCAGDSAKDLTTRRRQLSNLLSIQPYKAKLLNHTAQN
jgi:hypothetical protein